MVYTDPTSGEYVGEFETVEDGEVTRHTEWFDELSDARYFSKTGIDRRSSV
jgi:hypothetical protein